MGKKIAHGMCNHDRDARQFSPPHACYDALQFCRRAYICRSHHEVTMLRDDINNALKDAMKAKDGRRVSTLRLVNSTLKNADIEARGQGRGPLGDDELLGLLQKMVKQRRESIDLYEKGGRAEL